MHWSLIIEDLTGLFSAPPPKKKIAKEMKNIFIVLNLMYNFEEYLLSLSYS